MTQVGDASTLILSFNSQFVAPNLNLLKFNLLWAHTENAFHTKADRAGTPNAAHVYRYGETEKARPHK